MDGALKSSPISSTLGIAHTRWATHGPPSDVNAHPHVSMHGEVAVVHNAVIDNFASLRQALISQGFVLDVLCALPELIALPVSFLLALFCALHISFLAAMFLSAKLTLSSLLI